jgi:hypothetical protein
MSDAKCDGRFHKPNPKIFSHYGFDHFMRGGDRFKTGHIFWECEGAILKMQSSYYFLGYNFTVNAAEPSGADGPSPASWQRTASVALPPFQGLGRCEIGGQASIDRVKQKQGGSIPVPWPNGSLTGSDSPHQEEARRPRCLSHWVDQA